MKINGKKNRSKSMRVRRNIRRKLNNIETNLELDQVKITGYYYMFGFGLY